jgi:signal transduction histidine kinase
MKTAGSKLATPRTRLRGAEDAILAGRLIAAQESERRRIARDLHDNLGQKLSLLCIEIGSLSARTRVVAPELAEAIASLSERAKDIISDVHCLSHDLHPPKLELLGLSQAISGLCRDMSSRFSMRIEFRQSVGRPSVSAHAALCLFRVTQEALQNVVKHSGARAAMVRLTRARQNIRLHVADDGKGFAGRSNDGAGLGLLSMRERVHMAGGRLVIRSAPGRGTRVAVTLDGTDSVGDELRKTS